MIFLHHFYGAIYTLAEILGFGTDNSFVTDSLRAQSFDLFIEDALPSSFFFLNIWKIILIFDLLDLIIYYISTIFLYRNWPLLDTTVVFKTFLIFRTGTHLIVFLGCLSTILWDKIGLIVCICRIIDWMFGLFCYLYYSCVLLYRFDEDVTRVNCVFHIDFELFGHYFFVILIVVVIVTAIVRLI